MSTFEVAFEMEMTLRGVGRWGVRTCPAGRAARAEVVAERRDNCLFGGRFSVRLRYVSVQLQDEGASKRMARMSGRKEESKYLHSPTARNSNLRFEGKKEETKRRR